MQKDQIDISILNANKYLTSQSRKEAFIYDKVKVEEKYDGIKVTIVHIDKTGDYKQDFIVSYKSNIIYPDEFEYAVKSKIRPESINNSQFTYIFDILKKCDSKSLPLNYEFFVEFLMKKPTLQHKYKKIGAILLAYSPCSYEVKFGRLFTKPKGFYTDSRETYAKKLGFDYPRTVFEGNFANFERGIKSQELNDIFRTYKNLLKIENIDLYIQQISEMFLKMESKYGGKPEGYVLTYPGFLLKIQQPYQVDPKARAETRSQYQGDPDTENAYWANVRLAALNIIGASNIKGSLNEILQKYGEALKKYKLNFTHPKKTQFQIKDDIQGNIKMIVIKRLKGNNNFLFLGKFRILTKAHYNIIKNGLKKYDNGVVCLVTSKDTKEFEDLRLEMLKSCFPEIEIIQHSTGNIISIMNKSKMNINAVLCGSDRYNDYVNQLRANPDIQVVETPRDTGAISATAVIENLNSEIFFKRNTPSEIHSMYNKILKRFKSLGLVSDLSKEPENK